ncbi:V-type ATP synthase subunit E [Thermoplasma volcanium]|uniref:A-type ATP synthase subunit E n=1 Tax=Thermoplasma volcanium (strain ATCC 51530 / DSM 4299 / JCM 9571 / NBRC 15438 / GSS1) TaxID=273116 RepID=AATE_THEVO|nr:V-type ATP synthase subunit E [Thermoplasma volcanium]Q97CQ3.2 RecName: Full=V-type ATP synthase subunit E; AltName: Full=V-ATPase subunit E [Thermoplasma volcanium GSS1]
MSLEQVIKEIEQSQEIKKKEILENTKNILDKMEAEKKAKIDEIRALYQEKMRAESSRITASIIDKANIEARSILRNKIEEILEGYVSAAQEILRNIRNMPEYPALLNKMIEVAKKYLGQDCIIKVDSKDKAVAPSSGITYSNIDPYGGILASSRDGKVELDLRVSSIMEEVLEKIKVKIYTRLEE